MEMRNDMKIFAMIDQVTAKVVLCQDSYLMDILSEERANTLRSSLEASVEALIRVWNTHCNTISAYQNIDDLAESSIIDDIRALCKDILLDYCEDKKVYVQITPIIDYNVVDKRYSLAIFVEIVNHEVEEVHLRGLFARWDNVILRRLQNQIAFGLRNYHGDLTYDAIKEIAAPYIDEIVPSVKYDIQVDEDSLMKYYYLVVSPTDEDANGEEI